MFLCSDVIVLHRVSFHLSHSFQLELQRIHSFLVNYHTLHASAKGGPQRPIHVCKEENLSNSRTFKKRIWSESSINHPVQRTFFLTNNILSHLTLNLMLWFKYLIMHTTTRYWFTIPTQIGTFFPYLYWTIGIHTRRTRTAYTYGIYQFPCLCITFGWFWHIYYFMWLCLVSSPRQVPVISKTSS